MKMSCSVLVEWKRYGCDSAAFPREIFKANRLSDQDFCWSIRPPLKLNVTGKTSSLKWNAFSMAARHRRHTPPLRAFAKPPGDPKNETGRDHRRDRSQFASASGQISPLISRFLGAYS
jgi:hypothetical protein